MSKKELESFILRDHRNILLIFSKAKNAQKRKLQGLQNDLSEAEKKLKKTEDALITESVGREPSDTREDLLINLEQITKRESELKKEIQKYRDCDPEYISQVKTEIEDLKTAINRWTENIYILKSYIKNTFQMENEAIEQNFDIPPEMDYIEN